MGKRETELFFYKDGALYWKTPTSNRVKVGQEAGTVTTNGYKTVRYDSVVRMLHRVIWDYHHEKPCEGFLVDHKDGNRLNNDVNNLRLCDYSQNAANSKVHGDSAVELKGVHLHTNGKYRAQISKRGKRVHLGLFASPEEAHSAYIKEAEKLFGEYTNGGSHRKEK